MPTLYVGGRAWVPWMEKYRRWLSKRRARSKFAAVQAAPTLRRMENHIHPDPDLNSKNIEASQMASQLDPDTFAVMRL